jgi:hypothetical protein
MSRAATLLHFRHAMSIVLYSFAASIALSPIASPQDAPTLADIARKAQEERQGTKPGRIYTNDDLKTQGLPAPDAAAMPAPTPAKTEPPTSDAATLVSNEPAPAPPTEEAWRARIARARDDLHRNEIFAEALQSRINALSADFAARDDPAQRAQLADDRQKALEELERVKHDIESSRKAVADIEEEGRRAGIPPGWLR